MSCAGEMVTGLLCWAEPSRAASGELYALRWYDSSWDRGETVVQNHEDWPSSPSLTLDDYYARSVIGSYARAEPW